MADKKLMETVYGKYHKYEIYKVWKTFTTTFYIYKDGKYWKSTTDGLARAVEITRKED
ncbi:MAG: hypothetical protein FWG50_07275 [Kiritimatiellaeota bacterium]|nr:hypothetical protein [Kiritimatiellota bacterium]